MQNQNIKNVSEANLGDYVILASGLGFTVTEIKISPIKKLVLLGLKRHDKKLNENQHTQIIVTDEGFYLGTKEPNLNDVVRISDVTRKVFLTPAGQTSNQPIDLFAAFNNEHPHVKVQTRNGFWFNVDSVHNYGDGYLALKLGQIASVCKSRQRLYSARGRTQHSEEAAETYFDPYDIVRVEAL